MRCEIEGIGAMEVAVRAGRMTVAIRPLAEADIEAAEHVCRLAFGTFFGLPDPVSFRGDGALVRPRYLADPSGVLVAETGDGVVGSGGW